MFQTESEFSFNRQTVNSFEADCRATDTLFHSYGAGLRNTI